MVNLNRESETAEFKKNIGRLDKEILGPTAMLNKHNAGTVYFGADDHDEVLGMGIGNDTVEKIRSRIDSFVLPKVLPEIKVCRTEVRYQSVHPF